MVSGDAATGASGDAPTDVPGDAPTDASGDAPTGGSGDAPTDAGQGAFKMKLHFPPLPLSVNYLPRNSRKLPKFYEAVEKKN